MLLSAGELAGSTTVSPLVGTQPDVTSSASNVVEFPVRNDHAERDSLEHEIVLELATADDVASGMTSVVERIRADSGAAGAEWWATGDDGALELVAEEGTAYGRSESLPLGSAGVFVLHGGRFDSQVESALTSLSPILRRRAAEERLARTTIQLARRNEALEDFAALVAHELKTPLHAALLADDPSRPVEDALHLVDALLEAAQNEGERTFASAAESLDQAVEDLGAEVEITADLATTLPLPPEPLRVILRNLISNAVAAGAQHVHVVAARSPRSWRLLVDDDGVGVGDVDGYAGGSGLGLSLCSRIAGRFGGVLGLVPRPSGGTRATLEFAEARP
jgi:signal transduction histidine kinase